MASPQERFLQDHKIEEYVDKKGKTRRRYVYMGDLYIRQLTEKQRRTERYLGVLVALAAGGLAVFAATWNTPVNAHGFFAVLSILAMIPALGVLTGAVSAFCKQGDLTSREYHERLILLRTMSLLGAALLLVLSLGYALHGAWPAFAAALPAAALYALVGVHELKVKYTVKARQA